MMTMGVLPDGTNPDVEQVKLYSVILCSVGKSPIRVMLEYRKLHPCRLAAARDLIRSSPVVLLLRVNQEIAYTLYQALTDAEADVMIVPHKESE